MSFYKLATATPNCLRMSLSLLERKQPYLPHTSSSCQLSQSISNSINSSLEPVVFNLGSGDPQLSLRGVPDKRLIIRIGAKKDPLGLGVCHSEIVQMGLN